MFFGVWYIRGLMDPMKQVEIISLVRSNNLSCIGILEIKVNLSLFEEFSARLLSGWLWTSNYNFSSRGRIWFGWKP